jgi:hypothetical protein
LDWKTSVPYEVPSLKSRMPLSPSRSGRSPNVIEMSGRLSSPQNANSSTANRLPLTIVVVVVGGCVVVVVGAVVVVVVVVVGYVCRVVVGASVVVVAGACVVVVPP